MPKKPAKSGISRLAGTMTRKEAAAVKAAQERAMLRGLVEATDPSMLAQAVQEATPASYTEAVLGVNSPAAAVIDSGYVDAVTKGPTPDWSAGKSISEQRSLYRSLVESGKSFDKTIRGSTLTTEARAAGSTLPGTSALSELAAAVPEERAAATVLARAGANGARLAEGAGGLLSKVPWLTKVGGALGWVAILSALYENTIGRRNEVRQETATGLMNAGMRGQEYAGVAGDEAYARLIPDIARESEAAAYAGDRTEVANALSLNSLISQSQESLRQSAQVVPMTADEYMLRVKAEMAARGG